MPTARDYESDSTIFPPCSRSEFKAKRNKGVGHICTSSAFLKPLRQKPWQFAGLQRKPTALQMYTICLGYLHNLIFFIPFSNAKTGCLNANPFGKPVKNTHYNNAGTLLLFFLDIPFFSQSVTQAVPIAPCCALQCTCTYMCAHQIGIFHTKQTSFNFMGTPCTRM